MDYYYYYKNTIDVFIYIIKVITSMLSFVNNPTTVKPEARVIF